MCSEKKVVDDFGNEWVRDHYTGKLILDGTPIGACIPGLHVRYWTHDLAAHKQSQIWFHEMEASCNTCKNLQRVQHAKDRFGFVDGVCKMSGESLRIHPHDPMHKQCYESRWQ